MAGLLLQDAQFRLDFGIKCKSYVKHEYKFYAKRFQQEISDKILTIKKGLSWEMMETFPEHYFDMIYLNNKNSQN